MKYYPMFDLFDDFFTGNTTSDVMKTDIVEKDGNYEMSMELPGVKKEDIQMELKDGYLKVTATHGSNTEDKDEMREQSIEIALKSGIIKKNELAIIVAGTVPGYQFADSMQISNI